METTNDFISITGGPLKPHEYVLVKSYLNAGDTRFIQNHSAKTRQAEGGRDAEVVLTLGDAQFATFQRAVKGWSLHKTITRADGVKAEVPVPFIPERLEQCIEELDNNIYTYILEKINKMYSTEDSESDKNFRNAVVDSSEDNLQAERVLRLKA